MNPLNVAMTWLIKPTAEYKDIGLQGVEGRQHGSAADQDSGIPPEAK